MCRRDGILRGNCQRPVQAKTLRKAGHTIATHGKSKPHTELEGGCQRRKGDLQRVCFVADEPVVLPSLDGQMRLSRRDHAFFVAGLRKVPGVRAAKLKGNKQLFSAIPSKRCAQPLAIKNTLCARHDIR